MSFLSICLCPGFEKAALNVGLSVALLKCAADSEPELLQCRGPCTCTVAELSRGEGRQREGTRPYKCSWFVPALAQWGHGPAGDTHGSPARLGEG